MSFLLPCRYCDHLPCGFRPEPAELDAAAPGRLLPDVWLAINCSRCSARICSTCFMSRGASDSASSCAIARARAEPKACASRTRSSAELLGLASVKAKAASRSDAAEALPGG